MRNIPRITAFSMAAMVSMLTSSQLLAQKKYDVGATDREIKIGNIMPYSGPASAYGIIGKVEEAYFKKINEEGGINGRKINFISYDDVYSPPKAVEQARKLVESDEVLFVFSSFGTPSNSAIHKYMNSKRVPQLFIPTGASKWNDPKNFPWTMNWLPSYQTEARVYAKYILKEKPNGKIAIFYQNDDYGKDYLKGVKDGLGVKASSMIVMEESYEATEPTIESHIVKLKASGADILIDVTTQKFAAQAIKKMAEIGWTPLHFLNSVSASVGNVMKPAGLENAQGIISANYAKDATDPQWKSDAGMREFDDFLKKYMPGANREDAMVILGYNLSQTVVSVLERCGDNLTRENIMKTAASIKSLKLGGLLPGIEINTGEGDFAPIEHLQLMRFKGDAWELFGEVVNAE